MSEQFYKRCKLHKDNAVQISWVEASEAEIGNRMVLDDPETGEPGWRVDFVYATAHSQRDLPPYASKAFRED